MKIKQLILILHQIWDYAHSKSCSVFSSNCDNHKEKIGRGDSRINRSHTDSPWYDLFQFYTKTHLNTPRVRRIISQVSNSFFFNWNIVDVVFPDSSDSKESACSAGYPSFIPGLGRIPGEGDGNPLQCSCLENSMDRGYSPWGRKESDITKRLTVFHSGFTMFC